MIAFGTSFGPWTFPFARYFASIVQLSCKAYYCNALIK